MHHLRWFNETHQWSFNVSISLHDVRWQSGGIEELHSKAPHDKETDEQQAAGGEVTDVYEEFDPFEGLEEGHKCTACDCSMEDGDRDMVITHYRSQWHRLNARRVVRGRIPLTEEQFEELETEERKVGDEASSSSDSDASDDDELPLKLGSSHIHFVHNDEVFSIYRCILHPGESTVSLSIFARSLDCAIFLLAGGHFAAGVFKNGKLVAHKAFHRYVVRAKQGGAQSASDKAKGAAHSAGATLRRYNERALAEDIVKVLGTWTELLAATPLIFIRCASYQRVIFHDIDDFGFNRKDPRLRTIPFETKRPLLEEVKRAWERLSSVTCHGPKNEFLAERSKRKQRAKTLTKKKRPDVQWRLSDETDEKEKAHSKERKTDHLKPMISAEERVEVDQWPTLDRNSRRAIYAMVKENKEDALVLFINERSVEVQAEILDYLKTNRFSSDNETYLHLAARSGADKIVQYLLEASCDPSIKNDDGLVPYAVSANKAIKQVFVQFRSENLGKWNWTRCHIPEPVQLTDEQIAKLNEKKKERKQKQKEKIRMKKEAEKKEAEELAARAAFLAMSDREKRAAAAEARLARLAEGLRCAQCGVAFAGSGFECMELKFCSPSCVAIHRQRLTSSS